MVNFSMKKTQSRAKQINGELIDQDIAEVKLDERKKVEDFHMYKEFEDAKVIKIEYKLC